MGEARAWPALTIEASEADTCAAGSEDPALRDIAERLLLILDDWRVAAIEDLAVLPLPPGGLWDPTYPPIPEPPPSPVRWRVFFESTADRDGARRAIADTLPELRQSATDIPDEDWAARSQRSLTAIRAGGFIVAPPWDVPSDRGGAELIVIEPSMGFGTGHHATTRLCLEALSSTDLRGKRVLDVGTGSGVLAIAAALRGARSSLGVDVDPDAIRSALTSAALNPVAGPLAFEVADFRSRTDLVGDVVAANLTSGMLTRAAARIRALVAPGGTLIVSGFDVSEEAAVHAALAPSADARRNEEEGWVCLVLADLGGP